MRVAVQQTVWPSSHINNDAKRKQDTEVTKARGKPRQLRTQRLHDSNCNLKPLLIESQLIINASWLQNATVRTDVSINLWLLISGTVIGRLPKKCRSWNYTALKRAFSWKLSILEECKPENFVYIIQIVYNLIKSTELQNFIYSLRHGYNTIYLCIF